MKKRFTFLLLTLALLFSVINVPVNFFAASAQENTEITVQVDSVTAKAGDSNVAVGISLKNNPGIAGFSFCVDYDADNLVFVKSEVNISGGYPVATPINDHQINIAWAGSGTYNANEKVATLYFNVPKTATVGKHDIKISYRDGYDSFYQYSGGTEQDISTTATNGYIQIEEAPPTSKLTVAAGAVTAWMNDTDVIVPIVLSNNTGLSGFSFCVNYDESRLEYKSAEIKIDGGYKVINHPEGYAVCLAWTDENQYVQNTSIAELHFSVKSNAKRGKAYVNILFRDSYDSFYKTVNKQEIDIECIAESGYVNIMNHNFGEWQIVKEATCTETGLKRRSCTDAECSVVDELVIPKIAHNYVDTVTEATCSSEGYTTHQCSYCGASYVDTRVEKKAHTYGDWENHNETQHKRSCACGDVQYEDHAWDSGKITTQPTCKDKGVKTYTCSVCGATKTEDIPITNDHSYGNWVKINETTHKHTCGICGKEETANHNWNSGVVTTQPTHLTEGVKTYTCSDCGATKTEPVSKLTTHTYGDWEKHNETQHKRSCACGDIQYENHAWDSGKITTQPTCKDKGVKTYTCSVCGATKTEDIPITNDHSYGNWVIINETTHKHTCGICGKEETASHNWNSGVVTTQPTEDNTGIRTYTCATCGATKEEIIPKLDHQHEYGSEWHSDASNHWVECSCGDKDKIAAHIWNAGIMTKEATCLEDGIMTYTCTVCGYNKTETVKGEHSVGEWVIVREATCSVDGLKERKCSVCGEVIESEDIKATGHSAAEWVIENEPTCTETGLKQQKCSVCGEILDEETIPAIGHHFGDWTVENVVLKRTCACGEIETKIIDKKAEELPPSDDGVKVDIGDSISLPVGTSVITDNLMDDLSDTEKDKITNAVKVIVSNDNGIELVSIYDISLEFEGAKIQPDGTVKVELPIPEESSQKFDSYQVVYIDDNGVAHEMPTEIKDGEIIFTTDHFSKYAVVGIINAETPPEPSIIPWLIVGSVVVCAAVVFVVILINKKRKKSQQNAREESEI